ncbi:DNA-directed RNA polymerase subunit beta [Striga asiatica]|uniref:DNA-directed RNA polymerase subunit beta n=1 Tax=Striga asiatica TaxID=4170 RepID=A0A5A7PBN4_STRAF|nr:DNA-directed RNA polymerase subunit beta [Striga asiatica]
MAPSNSYRQKFRFLTKTRPVSKKLSLLLLLVSVTSTRRTRGVVARPSTRRVAARVETKIATKFVLLLVYIVWWLLGMEGGARGSVNAYSRGKNLGFLEARQTRYGVPEILQLADDEARSGNVPSRIVTAQAGWMTDIPTNFRIRIIQLEC